MACTDQQVYRCVNVDIILHILHIHFLLDISYRSHVSWRRGHGNTEASADIGPCIIYEEDTVSSSSSREDRDNLSNVMEEKQQELFGPSPTLWVFAVWFCFRFLGQNVKTLNVCHVNTPHRSARKTKRGRSCANPLDSVLKIRNVRGGCVYPSLGILTTTLFVYLLFCQLRLQTVEKRKMDRWNNAF